MRNEVSPCCIKIAQSTKGETVRARRKFKTEGWGEATEFTLIILPLPLGEGWGEGFR